MARKRKQMAEINVVPYIDVMLVLLIIFMITAPLLQLGVEIELPTSDAQPIEKSDDPIVVTVSENGDMRLSLDGETTLVDAQSLRTTISAIVRRNPEVQVLIGGDRSVDYGRIYEAMVVLQQSGVPRIGLMSDPLEDD